MITTTSRTDAPLRVGLVSTFPPSRCGIARFSASLVRAISRSDPAVSIDVARILRSADGPRRMTSSHPTAMEFDPNSQVSTRAASRHLNDSDVVLVQHEFGIYGADDGSAVLELVDRIDRPLFSVLHTVVARPSTRQRFIIESLAGAGTGLIVPSVAAARLLTTRYDVGSTTPIVISHGSDWQPTRSRLATRRELITWGLLGPGKGLERSIRAVAQLADIRPPLRYRIVGQTHPEVLRTRGLEYRESLEQLASDLGVAGIVQFIDRYVEDEELGELVAASDVVLIPYDNDEQICSGVLVDALSAARPVVATRFPHAVELLSGGAGVVVGHDADELAKVLRDLLDDEVAYGQHAREAHRVAPSLAWTHVAGQYLDVLRRSAVRLATA